MINQKKGNSFEILILSIGVYILYHNRLITEKLNLLNIYQFDFIMSND